MLVNALEAVTFIALVLYIILGGADYGAGILEIFRPLYDRSKNIHDEITAIINKAIGPVWETNHIWLILIIVILFNGFPVLYTTMTVYLHIPIVAVLLGIVLRGVAFTFRHYDLYPGKMQTTYTVIFSLSSLWTSLWLGIIAGAIVMGRIDPEARGFFQLYIYPWFNFFCLSVGIFVACVFTYLASSFLIDETRHSLMRSLFRKRAFIANIILIISGGLVFLTAAYEYPDFFKKFTQNHYSLAMVLLATLCWFFQELYRRKIKLFMRRILVAAQVIFILLGFFFVQAPTIIATRTGLLSMENTAAPEATLVQLVIALLVGLVIILPSIALLFWIFKFKDYKKGA